MFEGLDEIGKSDGGKKAASFAIALIVEALIVLAIIITPLIFFSVLPDSELLTFLIAPPPPPSDRAPVVQQTTQVASEGFVAPTAIPTEIPPPSLDDGPMVATNIAVNTGIATAVRGADTGIGTLVPIITAPTTTAAPPPPPPKKPTVAPTRIGGDVLSARLLRQVNPTYPPMARTARVQGVVVLEVQVDEDGDVTEVVIKSGPALLQKAAADAVKQWKYSPTMLNGEPIPVLAEVRVTFNLN